MHELFFYCSVCFVFSCALCVLSGKYAIRAIKKIQIHGQPIRSDGPATHLEKSGTPTMGGAFVVFSIVVSYAMFGKLNQDSIVSILAVIAFAWIGFVDDMKKILKRTHAGMSGKKKLVAQIAVSCIAIASIQRDSGDIVIPFIQYTLHLPYVFWFMFAVFVMVGSSNAVNLTDGLDGLVAKTGMVAFLGLGVICIVQHNLHDDVNSNLAFMSFVTSGACLGFLWHNSKPAAIFMGDTGSIALGGLFGFIGVSIKQEILLALIGGIFVAEALSVIIQVGYFKLTKGKRVFRMAPLHHHFEQGGMKETKVVERFFVVCVCLCMISVGWALWI